MEPDELFSLRNYYWMGNYQNAISEGTSLSRLPDRLRVERDEYIYRSYIALGQTDVVLGEIPDSPDTAIALRAVKMLATYLNDPEGSAEIVTLTLKEWLASPEGAGNASLQLMAAIVFAHTGEVREALKAIHQGTTMEQCALLIQLYIRMDRVDQARRQLQLMQQADADAPVTQLTTAWVHLAAGEKFQEAAYIFDDLIDKYGSTVMLLNASAVANMHLGNYEDAEKSLIEALSKSQSDPDTLFNLIAVSQHLDKPPEYIRRHINSLRAAAPHHPSVQALAAVESSFDRMAATLAT